MEFEVSSVVQDHIDVRIPTGDHVGPSARFSRSMFV